MQSAFYLLQLQVIKNLSFINILTASEMLKVYSFFSSIAFPFLPDTCTIMDMRLFLICLFSLICFSSNTGKLQAVSNPPEMTSSFQDTLYRKQLLYNGRVWKSRYLGVMEHEFFLTRNCLSGSVTINGMAFSNVLLRYDVYNDELVLMVDAANFIQLNKEAVEDFILPSGDKSYRFENLDRLTGDNRLGYGQIIHKGAVCLALKHYKEIKLLAVENTYDTFIDRQSLFIINKGEAFRIKTRKDFLKALGNHGEEIRDFIREKHLKVSVRRPESMIPALEYYDSMILRTK